MLDHNYESSYDTCIVNEGLHGIAAAVSADAKASQGGWEWTDENRGKWGWVSDTVGSQLQLNFSTQQHNVGTTNTSGQLLVGSLLGMHA